MNAHHKAILATVTSLLFFLVSLSALIINAVTETRLAHYSHVPIPTTTTMTRQSSLQPYVPPGDLNPDLMHAQIALCTLGFVSSLLALAHRLDVARHGSDPNARGGFGLARHGNFLVAGLMFLALAVLVVLGWTFAEYQNGATVTVSQNAGGGVSLSWNYGNSGRISWEQYTCALNNAMTATGAYGNWWGVSCGLNMAAKWLTVPVLILAVLTAVTQSLAVAAAAKPNERIVKIQEPIELLPAYSQYPEERTS